MKNYKLIISSSLLTILIILSTFIITSCNMGNNGNHSGGNTTEASGTIGSAGGIIQVNNPSSPLYGAKIEIPPNALSQDTVISIKTGGQLAPLGDANSSVIVDFNPSGTVFNIPATVTIPLKNNMDSECLGIFIAETGDTAWTLQESLPINYLSNKISFNIAHFSQVLVTDVSRDDRFRFKPGDEIKIYFYGSSSKLDTAQNAIAKATIKDALINGPWKPLADSICVKITEVNSSSTADIIIAWEKIPYINKIENGHLTITPVNAYTYQRRIVFNEDIDFHITTDFPISGTDLYSIAAHEAGHAFWGFPMTYANNNNISDDIIQPGENQRSLQAFDRELFYRFYKVFYVDSNAINGVKFTATSTGIYRFTIIGGAYNDWPVGSPGSTGWYTGVIGYKNRPIEWIPYNPGSHNYFAGNADYILGSITTPYSTYAEAESNNKGKYVDIPLNTGEYVIFLIPDCKCGDIDDPNDNAGYGDNQGGIYLSYY